MSSAEEGDAAPEPNGSEDAASEDSASEDAATEDAAAEDAATEDAPTEETAADTDADANAEDRRTTTPTPTPTENSSTPPKTPKKPSGPQFASSPRTPGSAPRDSTFTCGSPVAPPHDATFTCSPRRPQGPAYTSTPRSSAATRLDSTFTRSPRSPKARRLDETFPCSSRYPQDAAFDATFDLDSSRAVPVDTTFTRSEVHPDGVKVTYTRALFPDKTIITKETIIPTSQDDSETESLHDQAVELLNSTFPPEDAFEMEDVPEEGCFPKLKPFPIRRTSARKHAAHCPGVCGGKCQSDSCGTGRPLSAPTGTRPRRPPSQSSRGLDSTSTHSAAGAADCCGDKTARPRRGGSTSTAQGALSKRLGLPVKRHGFSPRRRAMSQPMAVLERKVETRRTYIMTPEGAQLVAEFTDGEDLDLSSSRRPPPRPRPLPPDAGFTLPPLPSCRPDAPPTPIDPYYPASIPQGLNPNQLMEYAMEQIQLPPQVQAQIDARPYKNPNEMLEWSMQAIQLPPHMEANLQARQQAPADYHFQRAMQDIQLPPPLEEHLQQRLQSLPPGELLPMGPTAPGTPRRPASSPAHAMQESSCGVSHPAALQSPPLTPQRPLASRQRTPMQPVRLNLDDAEDVFSPCSPGPQTLQASQAFQGPQAPYSPDGVESTLPEAKTQRKRWSRHPAPPSMEYMTTADFVGGAALHELPGWARRAWEEDSGTQPHPDTSNWREIFEMRPSSLPDCAVSSRGPRTRRQWSHSLPPPNMEPMSTYEFTGGGHLDQLPPWARTRMMEDIFSGQHSDQNSWTDGYEGTIEGPSSPCGRAPPR